MGRATSLYEEKGSLGAGSGTCAEQASAAWPRPSFPGRVERGNLAEFWLAGISYPIAVRRVADMPPSNMPPGIELV